MNIAKERRAIDTALDTYRQLLDGFSDEHFIQTPPMGGWSYAEVYDHILKSSLGSTIALERCTHNNCPPTKKGMGFWGHYVMATGLFPPFKVKVPEAVADKIAPKKINIEDAKNLIIKTRKRIEGVTCLIADAKENARWLHPRLGMLNAAQWFKFTRAHLQHHIKQLERIKSNFKKG
ncbi:MULTISPECIES: DinB family protein [unclassified Mucilaginibacter]|uniref:DinB family protein n=1 Tax=unclassified Mucilaginibacter TaxID=2617802 RepID=UPI002AC9665F|nr:MULTISPECIES: DinB family protein [unclassified Mucilaginibacter]MEB0263947.1 DinB family protein [Mucilaginibacter sp. 10I4]MEB0278527.1 DinB family protein [Mucilaginibacter sp. 10B2]MEB0303264.1 DinB family protein [Mucilaginibacter sp. 5C4]WPX23517.1 DinB family protein [Mucilaginibacter sp. 5C4]